jgi:hypothetical protein
MRVMCCFIGALVVAASVVLGEPKSVPAIQAIPQAHEQVSFQREGMEIARYHFGSELRRPFLFPIVGPSGRSLTRMGHPRDPISHSHHNSVWISHVNVNGVSFWEDRAKGRIVHQRVEALDEDENSAWVLSTNSWIEETTKKTLISERRRTAIHLLDNSQYFLLIDLQLECKEPVTLGKTPFGLVGVRMAKTIGVHDGGGTIRNSEGQVDEKDVLWKKAKWVDYSGPITNKAIEGITLMDHPENPNHPTIFHVRNDGWMGASLTFDGPRTIEPEKPLRLRYGLFVHSGAPSIEVLDNQWKVFSQLKVAELQPVKR